MGRTSDARQRLIDAALGLIWDESYGAVTIDDICRRADAGKGSFYHFFPDKAALAIAALEDMWATQWKPLLDTHLSPAVPPALRFPAYLEAVVAYQRALARQHGKVLGCPLCSIGNEVCHSQAAVSTAIREIMDRKRRYFESSLRDALAAGALEPCDPTEKASALYALVNGLLSQARIMNDLKLLDYLPHLGIELLKARPPVAA